MLPSTARACGALCAAALITASARAETPRYPLGAELEALAIPAEPSDASPAAPEPTESLGLAEALALTLLHNPELASDALEMRAREAALLQAGVRPNPTLTLELEDFAGSGSFRGVRAAQTTLQLGQLVELGGKRAARVAAAQAEADLAAWDYETRRIDVLARTADAFVEVLAAQERRRLAAEAVELARRVERVARLRRRAGLASPAEEIRAGVAADVASVDREHAEHELLTARQALAAMWGATRPRFERAEGDLAKLPLPPTQAALAERALESPNVARWQAELARRDARRRAVRAERTPSVTLTAGPRHFAGPGATALVVGVSVPLPIWDRQRGATAEADARLAKLEHEARAERVRIETALAGARMALIASLEEARLLRSQVIPGIERAAQVMQRGYEEGRFAQIEVLDAERARVEALSQALRALVEAHHSAREIERLTGVPLEVQP